MKRLRTLGAGCFLITVVVIACASPPPQTDQIKDTPSNAPAAQRIAEAMVAAIHKLDDKTVAVIEFSELRGKALIPSAQGRRLAEQITTELVKNDEIKVVERTQLDKVMGELELGASGMVEESSAKAIGKLLGVEAIITGTVIKLGPETEIHSRLVRVKDGQILSATTTAINGPLTPRKPDVRVNHGGTAKRRDREDLAVYHKGRAADLRQKAESLLNRAWLYDELFGSESDWAVSTRNLAQYYENAARQQERLADTYSANDHQ